MNAYASHRITKAKKCTATEYDSLSIYQHLASSVQLEAHYVIHRFFSVCEMKEEGRENYLLDERLEMAMDGTRKRINNDNHYLR